MSDHILTRDELEEAYQRHFHAAKDIIRGRLSTLSKRIFIPLGLTKFDHGTVKYGEWDLTSRNWIQQGNQECFDWINYTVAELVAKERGLL